MDSYGDLYVTNQNSNTVTIYRLSTNGNVYVANDGSQYGQREKALAARGGVR